MIRMFVHVNKDPLFLSHASLETSLSHLGGSGYRRLDNDSSGPFQFMNWVEKKKEEKLVFACFTQLMIF